MAAGKTPGLLTCAVRFPNSALEETGEMEQEHFPGSNEWSLTESQDPASLRLCPCALRASWRLSRKAAMLPSTLGPWVSCDQML